MFYIPILGSLLEASGTIIEKKVIKKKNINYKNYIVYGFLTIVCTSIPFLFFFWKLSPEALELKNILIFSSIIIASLIANLLIFYSLKRKSLSEFEPIRLTQPLFTILLAFMLSFFIPAYADERNPAIILLALIASITLIIAHINKHHIKFDKYIIAALIGSFFFALELVLSKTILPYYSSWSFYFLRCLFILIISAAIFRPNLKTIDKQTHYFTWTTSLIWITYRVILYWSYESLGIVFTTITLSILTSIFIFVLAKIFLKEKPTMRQVISAAIIILCVIIAVIIQK